MLVHTDPGLVDIPHPEIMHRCGVTSRKPETGGLGQLSVEASRTLQAYPQMGTSSLRPSPPCSERHRGLGLQAQAISPPIPAKTASRSQMPVNVWADVSSLSTGRTWRPWRRWEEGKAPHLASSLASVRAVSEAPLSSIGREGRGWRPWERSECWSLLPPLTPNSDPDLDPVIDSSSLLGALRGLMLAASSTGSRWTEG